MCKRHTLDGIYAFQLLLVFLWVLVFFGARNLQAAFWILILLIIVVLIWIAALWNTDAYSAVLLIVYLIWLIFAAIVNWNTYQLNPVVPPRV
jgi:tryptophan-rich sensory protein